jgi:hypothetical protein
MATRSTIAIQNEDGTVTSVYCHWDGYPAHNGRILQQHYTDAQAVTELLSHGNMSELGERISPTVGSGHTFENGEPGTTVYYGRDRGEDDVAPQTFPNAQAWREAYGQEYDYLYVASEGAWYVGKHGRALKPLAPAVAAELFQTWTKSSVHNNS